MPTVLRIKNLRFYFYSNEHRPRHIHVTRGSGRYPEVKIELEPTVRVVAVKGFSKKDAEEIRKFVEIYRDDFLESWETFFDGKEKD